MSYNLVSPHYTTTKAKSGGRKRRWRRGSEKVGRREMIRERVEEGGKIRRVIRMGKIRGGKPMGCVIRGKDGVGVRVVMTRCDDVGLRIDVVG